MKWPWKKTVTQRVQAGGQEHAAPQPPVRPDERPPPAPEPQNPQSAAFARLTPRERQVFFGLMRGMKLREIADWLGVKYSTVNTHYKNVYKKLGVNSRAECLIRYAGQAGAEAGR